MSEVRITEIDVPPDNPLWSMAEGMDGNPRMFTAKHEGREFSVAMTRDDIGDQTPDFRWHISVAGRDRKVAPWKTMTAIAHQLRPGVVFVIGVPPKSWWINIHPGALHLWELCDENLTAQWRSERMGMAPT